MTRFYYVVTLFIFSVTISFSQHSFDLSFKLDIYPTGIIPGIVIDKTIGDKSAVGLRLGYNAFDHRDLGVHDEETGGGPGFTLGYQRYFKDGFKGWVAGVKSDVWFNHVDWFDVGVADGGITGETDIIVIQPTAEIGYVWLLKNNVIISPSFSFGFEWNVRTEGEPTGEGAIILIGIKVGKRF